MRIFKLLPPLLLSLIGVTQVYSNQGIEKLELFLQSGAKFHLCGWNAYLDGGTEEFCLRTNDGRELVLWLDNTIDSKSKCNFYVHNELGKKIYLKRNSKTEVFLIQNIEEWLSENYSKKEIERLKETVSSYFEESAVDGDLETEPMPKQEIAILALVELVEKIRAERVDRSRNC